MQHIFNINYTDVRITLEYLLHIIITKNSFLNKVISLLSRMYWLYLTVYILF